MSVYSELEEVAVHNRVQEQIRNKLWESFNTLRMPGMEQFKSDFRQFADNIGNVPSAKKIVMCEYAPYLPTPIYDNKDEKVGSGIEIVIATDAKYKQGKRQESLIAFSDGTYVRNAAILFQHDTEVPDRYKVTLEGSKTDLYPSVETFEKFNSEYNGRVGKWAIPSLVMGKDVRADLLDIVKECVTQYLSNFSVREFMSGDCDALRLPFPDFVQTIKNMIGAGILENKSTHTNYGTLMYNLINGMKIENIDADIVYADDPLEHESLKDLSITDLFPTSSM